MTKDEKKEYEELQKPKSAIIDSTELGTLGAYFESDTAQKKIKELKQQLVEKDKEIEQIKDNQNQKAIECLKEVEEYIYDDYKNCERLKERKSLTKYGQGCFDSDSDYIKFIDTKIKELKGELK